MWKLTHFWKQRALLGVLCAAASAPIGLTACGADEPPQNTKTGTDEPLVRMETSAGVIEIKLFAHEAPKTVANFLQYVEDGFFDGLIFHRVIPNFVIQGGGFEPGMVMRTPLHPSIENEGANGVKNLRGSLSMARTNDPNSATSQFFINLADNAFLDYTGEANPGYAVFGKVQQGLETVDAIAKTPTGSKVPHQDVPIEDVIIHTAQRVR